jgi:hypothetical protein
MGFAPDDRSALKWSYEGRRIGHNDPLLLMGSCFSERMGARLGRHLFEATWQPTGTLFDPVSLHSHLHAYWQAAQGHQIGWDLDAWQPLEGVWHHWNLHSNLSNPVLERAKEQARHAVELGGQALERAHTVVLTLGTAFVYFLKESGEPVANCHRFPAGMFERRLMSVEDMLASWSLLLQQIIQWKPDLQAWITVSPVRHSRDGLIENNRSKGRLLDLAHGLCEQFPSLHYIPSYEWLIDVLRDYRYYDADLVHPNYAATAFVYDRLAEHCMQPEAAGLLPRIESLVTADAHRPRYEGSEAHQLFEQQRDAQWAIFAGEYPALAGRRRG